MSHPCTACGGARDLELANMCATCIKTGVPFPETGAAQVAISKGLEAVQKLKPGSLTEREADMFYLYGRQLFSAIDRALGRGIYEPGVHRRAAERALRQDNNA